MTTENIEQFLSECPSDMRGVERMFLYTFIRGRRPQRVLEIGAFKGGSAMIISRALHENNQGRAVGIDPYPQADFGVLPVFGRYQLLVGTSPELISQAVATLGGPVDLAIIDGMHTNHAVRQDILGVLPHMATESYILLHDSYHYGVRKGIELCVASVPGLTDCGAVCNTSSAEDCPLVDPWITYCGLHMLRYQRRIVPVEEQLTPLYQQHAGLEASFGEDLLDHNEWACVDAPCARCKTLTSRLLARAQPATIWCIPTGEKWIVDRHGKRPPRADEALPSELIRVPRSVFQHLPSV